MGYRLIGEEEAGEEDPHEDHQEMKAIMDRLMAEENHHHEETLTGEVRMVLHLTVEEAEVEVEVEEEAHRTDPQTAARSQMTKMKTKLRRKETQQVANMKANRHHVDNAEGTTQENQTQQGTHGETSAQ